MSDKPVSANRYYDLLLTRTAEPSARLLGRYTRTPWISSVFFPFKNILVTLRDLFKFQVEHISVYIGKESQWSALRFYCRNNLGKCKTFEENSCFLFVCFQSLIASEATDESNEDLTNVPKVAKPSLFGEYLIKGLIL